MCITSSRSTLENTYIGAWDIELPELGYRHVLAYQNRVTNLAEGPNCMLLHIASKSNILPEWLVDTSEHRSFLADLYSYVDPINTSQMWMSRSPKSVNYVIEQGVYHIAILNKTDNKSVTDTLKLIPKNKLPSIKPKLLSFFQNNFSDFPILLCCFDNKDAKQATPILVHFPPKFPDTLMFNTIDAHGGFPNINKQIQFHQKIILGSYKKQSKEGSLYIKVVPEAIEKNNPNLWGTLAPYLPNYIAGIDFLDLQLLFPNKDICINLADIHNEKLPDVKFAILGNPSTEIKTKTRELSKSLFRVTI